MGRGRVDRLIGGSFLSLGLLVAAVVGWRYSLSDRATPSIVDLLEAGQTAFEEQRFDDAKDAVDRVINRRPDFDAAWLLLGQVYEARREFENAIEAYDRVSDSSPGSAYEARLAAGGISLNVLRRLSLAERYFDAAYRMPSSDPRAAQSLARLLGISGRSREQVPVLIQLIRLGDFSNFHLYSLVAGPELKIESHLLDGFCASDATDHEAVMASARIDLLEQRYSSARGKLEWVVRTSPHPRAVALLGQALLADGAPERELNAWSRLASERADAEPAVWRNLGERARRAGNAAAAVRCFAESMRLEPVQADVAFQLGQLLHQIDQERDAIPFLQWAGRLQAYRSAVEVANSGGSGVALRQVIELADELGLAWEAYGWCQMALRRDSGNAWARARLASLSRKAESIGGRRMASGRHPAADFDVSGYPLPDFADGAYAGNLPVEDTAADIRFREEAAERGISFQYLNGTDVAASGLRYMYEFTGGGVGVLDFDRDRFPDLYFSQGGSWQDRQSSAAPLDALFRNLDGSSFVDVTYSTAIVENGFSQGVAAGDLNNDGFPDLAVSNAGPNRLFWNNGDGTFSEETMAFRTDDGRWSTSCLIADFNADSIPDVYFVNYLAGDDVFEKVCPDGKGELRLTCRPQQFAASQDCLYFGSGDGHFVDVSEASGIVQADGRGMGAVAFAQPVESRAGITGLSLFVANDSSLNFQFAPVGDGGQTPVFEERALFSGLAVNGLGRAEACMGIAADDVNGDGRLDLFVTNFSGETNTLYVQEDDGLFLDQTERFDLGTSSVKMLGFGTAFLDADLDGYSDLIIANGHVNDTRDGSSLFQMPTQFYRNLRGRRFRELVAEESPGNWFDRRVLGRGLSTLDWNRDGRPDVVVTHLDVPVALLTNVCSSAGNWVTIQLVGTVSARDAIGTQVTVSHQNGQAVRQLVAGSSYQSSNERSLTFGLANTVRSVSLNVLWPSGVTSTVDGLPVNQFVTLVEPHPESSTSTIQCE
jgi:tetratricopeptide (TPR) repeat protein